MAVMQSVFVDITRPSLCAFQNVDNPEYNMWIWLKDKTHNEKNKQF